MSEVPPPFQPSPIEPLRVESLEYYTAMNAPVRPGILVAVGIVSIIVGALGILFSCGGVFTGVMRNNTRMVMTPTTVPSSAGHSGSASTSADFTSPAVMTDAHRQIALNGMDRAGNLSPQRRAMLDRLLARTGDKMFPFDESKMTQDLVAASVSQSGHVPGPAGAADDFFILANGRVEVGDDHASFSSNARDEPTINVYLPSGGASNAVAQQTTVMMPTFTTAPPKSTTPYNAYVVISAIDLMLAIYLLVGGIRTLAGAQRARRIHLFYAGLKIPAAVAGACAYYLILQEQMGGIPMGGASLAVIFATLECVAACLYPIALLIVMNVRSVKEYYRIST